MVRKGCKMKIEIEITTFHYDLLKRISDYSEIQIEKLVKGLVLDYIDKFDSTICELLEKNLPDSYYDDFINRYID